MSRAKTLVTGATGMTGSHTVQLLLKRGHTVRVLAHNEDERSNAASGAWSRQAGNRQLRARDAPRAVIAGHKRPGNDDRPKIIEEIRQYIRDFDRLAGTTTTARELDDKMLKLYPDRVNPGGALWLSARGVKGGL